MFHTPQLHTFGGHADEFLIASRYVHLQDGFRKVNTNQGMSSSSSSFYQTATKMLHLHVDDIAVFETPHS